MTELGSSPTESSDYTLATYEATQQAIVEGVPMVDVLQRAERIVEAITELGRISSINYGLSVAVNRESGARIWTAYRRGTDRVVANAQNKTNKRYDTVRRSLGSVTGYQSLRDANPRVIGLRRINADAKVDWGSFLDTFNGVANNERREEYRRTLKKQITAQRKIRKKHQIGNE